MLPLLDGRSSVMFLDDLLLNPIVMHLVVCLKQKMKFISTQK